MTLVVCELINGKEILLQALCNEELGTAIERINNWLGKPVVITCNKVTVAQLPHVFVCV